MKKLEKILNFWSIKELRGTLETDIPFYKSNENFGNTTTNFKGILRVFTGGKISNVGRR